MTALGHAGIGAAALPFVGTAFGALAGGTIGLDRQYVRKWFDGTEKLLHDNSHAQEALVARGEQIERLRGAAETDAQTKRILDRRHELHAPMAGASEAAMQAPAMAAEPAPTAADSPANKIHAATLQKRMVELQQAMQGPGAG